MTFQEALEHLEVEKDYLQFCVSRGRHYPHIDEYLKAVDVVVKTFEKIKTLNEFLSAKSNLAEELYNKIAVAYEDLWDMGTSTCEIY